MEGARIVLPTGSLTHRFFGVRKVDSLNSHSRLVSVGSGTLFWTKKRKITKWTWDFTGRKGCQNHTALNWRWWRHELECIQTDTIYSTDPWLRAPAVHGVSSIGVDPAWLGLPWCFLFRLQRLVSDYAFQSPETDSLARVILVTASMCESFFGLFRFWKKFIPP